MVETEPKSRTNVDAGGSFRKPFDVREDIPGGENKVEKEVERIKENKRNPGDQQIGIVITLPKEDKEILREKLLGRETSAKRDIYICICIHTYVARYG